MSIIQIFGTKKNSDTRKAERFFKERGIECQFIDLNEKGISQGELEAVAASIPIEKLIDRESKEFERLQLKHMELDIMETLLENPLLIKTPIVRCGKSAACGYDPEAWKIFVGLQREGH
jgi:arsenate reductase-like glutaredoxin family protein